MGVRGRQLSRSKVVKATLVFDVDDQGRCQSVTLLQNGLEHVAKRIDEQSSQDE